MSAISRRAALRGAAAAALLPIPGVARPDVAPADRKFVFVVCFGGWDPTRVFEPAFDHPAVSMEADAALASAGGVPFVDHPERPSVRAFFESHGARSVVLNGLLVPSVAHDACLHLVLTGRGAQDAADFPALLAGEVADRYTLPHVVVSGPSYPGPYGAQVTRSGSSAALVGLLSGDVLDAADQPVTRGDWRAESVVDRYLARRSAAWRDANGDLGLAFDRSVDRARTLKDLLHVLNWGGGVSFADQAGLALDLLRLGLSRCATLQYLGNDWDTHQQNSLQSGYFEGLFQELVGLQALLAATPGPARGTLADETVVVVLSEMGRTPGLNGDAGKDHWPVTSALLTGPGLTGGRAVGGADELFYGELLDLDSGAVDPGGAVLSVDVLGGTLLRLGGLDPDLIQQGTLALTGILTDA